MVPSATEAALGGGGIRFCTSRLGPGPGRLRLGQQSRGCCGWTSGPRTPGPLKRKVPSHGWGSRPGGQASCVSLPAPWPRVLPPASRVLLGLRAGGKEGLPSHPAARAKPLLFCDMEGAGSRSAACTMAGGPASVGLRARAHGSAAGKRSLTLQRQPRGLRGAHASLLSPDLLNPSFRVGRVGHGSWALAFGSRWRGGHPAACPAPGRLRDPAGAASREERGLWFAALSLLRGARVRISLPGDGGAVCRVPSVLWLLLLAQIYIPFPRFTPQGAGRF